MNAHRLFSNVRWGARWGLGFAAVYSLVALLIYAASGNEAFEGNGITVGVAIAGYIVAGIVAGCLVGLLRPLTTARFGAVLVGVIAGLLGVAGLLAVADGIRGMLNEWPAVLVVGGALGGWGGYHYWKRPENPDAPRRGGGRGTGSERE